MDENTTTDLSMNAQKRLQSLKLHTTLYLRITQRTNRLYIHLLAYPMGNLKLKNMAGKIKYVQFLA